jgi:hypothetical protein
MCCENDRDCAKTFCHNMIKICSLLSRLWPPVAEDFEQLWGEHDIAIFAPLCVSKIYVAMAARRQWERTVAPVGGNITFAYESSERSQESDEPWIGMPGLRRDVIWQIAERECFRFHFQVVPCMLTPAAW